MNPVLSSSCVSEDDDSFLHIAHIQAIDHHRLVHILGKFSVQLVS